MTQATIPVIIADGIVEPFERYLNWRAFTYKARDGHVPDLKAHLLARRNTVATVAKQRALQQITPYLYWTTTADNWANSTSLVILELCERLGKCTPRRRRTAAPLADAEYL